MKMPKSLAVATAIVALLTSTTQAVVVSMSALSTFGGGDGWRAPNEVLAGDTAGTAPAGNYNYLSDNTNRLERGLAYNPVTGNLILVSRSAAGNGIRVLNPSTGADIGFLNQGTGIITGGTFTTNMVAVGGDGAIYVSNLTTNAGTSAFKVYRWENESASAPTVFFGGTVPWPSGTPRLGDSLDVIGSGAGTTLVAGASGVAGFAHINSAGATAVSSFSPTSPGAGDFRLGITFGDSANEVWGKQTGASAAAAPLRLASYTGTGTSGTNDGSAVLTSGGEMALDYAVVNGVPLLATLDANTAGTADSTNVRIYDVTNPLSPVLKFTLENTSGALATNPDATGSIKWGAISGDTATLYAMTTKQGIQAFQVTVVPEASSFLAVGCVGLISAAYVARKRRRAQAAG